MTTGPVDADLDGVDPDGAALSGWLMIAAGSTVIALVIVVLGVGGVRAPSLGLTILLGVTIPAVLAEKRPNRSTIMWAALVLAVLPSAVYSVKNATGSGPPRGRNHDGGVYMTRGAAERVLRGENPYNADFREDIPRSWWLIVGDDGKVVASPLDHLAYMPAAVLVHVPFVALADAAGLTWDPRILAWAVLLTTALVIARRPEPIWARTATLLALGNAFTVFYLSYGTNDAQTACLVVLACLVARRHPGWAGALLAVAISCKFLVLVAVPPLAFVVLRREGLAGLRRWWTLPAVLAATIVPFLVVGPKALIEDAIAFNLGLTKTRLPAAGIGLPCLFPGGFRGPLLVVVTLGGVAFALLVPLAVVRRWSSMSAVGPASAVGLMGLLIPARTFQMPYLTLVFILLAPVWLLVGAHLEPDDDPDAARTSPRAEPARVVTPA